MIGNEFDRRRTADEQTNYLTSKMFCDIVEKIKMLVKERRSNMTTNIISSSQGSVFVDISNASAFVFPYYVMC